LVPARSSKTNTLFSNKAVLVVFVVCAILFPFCLFAQTNSLATSSDTSAATTLPKDITIFPNPSWPTNLREKAGYFFLTNYPLARDWARMDASGVVISFTVYIGAADSTTCGLKILDSYGTEVAVADPFHGSFLRNIISESYSGTSDTQVTIDMYWNGTTTSLPVEFLHEGMYLAQLTLQTKTDACPTVLEKEFYIKKTDVGHSTCGGNCTIAFLPAIWIKTRKPLLHVIRKYLKKQT
jgi:hypothetical protein